MASVAPLLVAVVLVRLMGKRLPVWLSSTGCLFGGGATYLMNHLLLRAVIPAFEGGDSRSDAAAWYGGFVEAAIPEEMTRFIVCLAFMLIFSKRLNLPPELLGGLVALGFAWFENLDYARTRPEWRLLAVVSHASSGIILGAFLRHGFANGAVHWWSLVGALLVPLMLHGLFDVAYFMVENVEHRLGLDQENTNAPIPWQMFPWIGLHISTMAIEIGWAIAIVRKLRKAHAESVQPMASFE